MNKERFHNELALALGYENIVNEKRYDIIVEENTEEQKIILKNHNGYVLFSFDASDAENIKESIKIYRSFYSKDIIKIADAVHHAYIQASTKHF